MGGVGRQSAFLVSWRSLALLMGFIQIYIYVFLYWEYYFELTNLPPLAMQASLG